MSLANGSNIVIIDQAKKKVISFVRRVSLAIADVRILINLMIIEISRVALLMSTD